MLWTGHTAPSAICPKHDLLWTEHTQSASVSTVYLHFRYGERWGCVLIYMAYFQIRWIVRKTTFVMTKIVKSYLLCLKCFVAQKGLIKSTSVLLSSLSSMLWSTVPDKQCPCDLKMFRMRPLWRRASDHPFMMAAVSPDWRCCYPTSCSGKLFYFNPKQFSVKYYCDLLFITGC